MKGPELRYSMVEKGMFIPSFPCVKVQSLLFKASYTAGDLE